jgi:hypothetical protein
VAGLRQFLDIGTGMPASGNIHEVAQSVAPQARVVYVDHDPIVLCHARALLISAPEGRTDFIEADLRQPLAILSEPARTLDFGRPAAVPEWRPAMAIDAKTPAQMWAGVALKPTLKPSSHSDAGQAAAEPLAFLRWQHVGEPVKRGGDVTMERARHLAPLRRERDGNRPPVIRYRGPGDQAAAFGPVGQPGERGLLDAEQAGQL